jgi:hypothetical protein
VGVVTLLEKIQTALGNHYGCAQTGDATEAVMELCAKWSLQPCTARRATDTDRLCRHCVAEEILTEIGKALDVYP